MYVAIPRDDMWLPLSPYLLTNFSVALGIRVQYQNEEICCFAHVLRMNAPLTLRIRYTSLKKTFTLFQVVSPSGCRWWSTYSEESYIDMIDFLCIYNGLLWCYIYLITHNSIKRSILKGHGENISLQQLHIIQSCCLLPCLAQHPLI